MTPRERVIAALEFRKPDRVPLNFFGTNEVWDAMKRQLKVETHEQVRLALGADMRYVGARYAGPSRFNGFSGFHAPGVDIWGVVWEAVQAGPAIYNEIAHSPLAEATTLAELREYAWPSPDWFDVSSLERDILELNRDDEYAIVFTVGSFVEAAWALRGLEQFLIDLVLAPEMAAFLLQKTTDLIVAVTERAMDAANGRVDILWSAGDIAGQNGLLCSPELWREYIKPQHRRQIVPYKEMGLKTRYHSDGSVIDVIGDLIEMGLDLLDPIQPHTPGMDPEHLAEVSGGRLAFYGGIDTQGLLPFGTPTDVEREVLRYITTLGSHGGYIIAASNAIQPDVPVENILTMFRTAREYRY